MRTEELVKRRRQLEMDVLLLLQRFRDETGLTPTSVDVNIHDVSLVGDESRLVALTGVRITVEV